MRSRQRGERALYPAPASARPLPGQIIGYRKNGAPIRLQAGGAGPAIVQHASTAVKVTSGTTVTISPAFTGDTTEGNCLVAVFSVNNVDGSSTGPVVTGITSVTTSGSAENWAEAAAAPNYDACPTELWIYINPDTGGGQKTVDINIDIGSDYEPFADYTMAVLADIYEVSGVAASSAVDVTSPGSSNASESWSSGATEATSQASEIAFGAGAGFVTTADTTQTFAGPGSGFTNETVLDTTVQNGGTGAADNYYCYQVSGYEVLSSTGTVTYAGTASKASSYNAAAVVTLKAAAGSTVTASAAQTLTPDQTATAEVTTVVSVSAAQTLTPSQAAAAQVSGTVTAAAAQTITPSQAAAASATGAPIALPAVPGTASPGWISPGDPGESGPVTLGAAAAQTITPSQAAGAQATGTVTASAAQTLTPSQTAGAQVTGTVTASAAQAITPSQAATMQAAGTVTAEAAQTIAPVQSAVAETPAGATVVNVWGTGAVQAAGYPPLLPTRVQLSAGSDSLSGSGTPTAGNWLFAVAAWRQDAGVDGVLQYPGTVNIRDDAHNFWMPVSVVPPETGIARASVWMAPAARVAENVFVSPTAYQAAMVVEIIEVEADCPWYDVVTVATAYTNQGTAVTCTIEPPSGLFSVGAFAFDNHTLTVSYTGDDWTAQPTVSVTGGDGESGDMVLYPFTTTSTGSAMPLEASGNGLADWAEILITVHGVTDAIAFPYQDLMQVENWPALVTEMACGQVLNSNWSFDAGIADWTAESSSITASGLYAFGNSAGSMLVTPSGDDDPGAYAGAVPVTPSSTYAMTAWITVPAGWADGALLGVEWYTAEMDEISSSFSSALTVTGSAQELTYSAAAPATAAYAQFSVLLSGTPGDTVLMYVGYAAIAIPGAYGAVPDDQLNWTDLSGRTFTKEAIRISRSIQYEQQSLEAGTLEIPLADNDGYLTPGNQQSPYWPYAGDDDVPIRVRAIWPNSVTPYSVLYSGFTDDVKVVLDEENLYQYLQVTASDAWSRLTAQMLTAAQQEYLAPIPAGGAGGFWPCDDMAGASAAANLAPTSLGPLAVQNSKFGSDDLVGAFGSTAISLLGDSGGTGGTGWSLSGLGAGKEANGLSLTLLPADPASLPPIADGVTVQLWVYLAPVVDTITWGGSLAACVGATGQIWSLSVGAPTGDYSGSLLFNVWDKITGDVTTTVVSAGDNWGATLALAVTFTQTTWAVYVNSALAGSGDANFAAVYNGVVFNGLNVPWAGLAGYCFNGTVQDVGLYPLALPQTAIVSGYDVASTAVLDEPDTSRLARVTGYGGFTPPLAMPGFGGIWPEASVDPVTQITDTIGQVVSDYYTNIASSTLALLSVDGTGAIVYRPRSQWYDRPIGIWHLGEHAPLPLNVNSRFASGIASWSAYPAGASAEASDACTRFSPGALLLTANGSTEDPQATAEQDPVTPGVTYAAMAWVCSPQGTTASAGINWWESGDVTGGVYPSAVTVPAGAWVFLIASGPAIAGADHGEMFIEITGTPADTVQLFVGYAAFTEYPGEAPYLRDVRLSNDRAQMFNAAILTQSGTGELTTFSGSTLNFSPTSGITVSAENETSVAQRGNVPYVATIYLQNTEQQIPNVAEFTSNPSGLAFVPAEGCMEDFASWVTQTLGAPVLRGDQVTLTPAATWQAMITALQAEIGDTVILSRRQIGAPPLVVVNYISSLSHEISIADEESPWVTTYQVSPAPSQMVLQCDSPVWGVLDGQNLLGW